MHQGNDIRRGKHLFVKFDNSKGKACPSVSLKLFEDPRYRSKCATISTPTGINNLVIEPSEHVIVTQEAESVAVILEAIAVATAAGNVGSATATSQVMCKSQVAELSPGRPSVMCLELIMKMWI